VRVEGDGDEMNGDLGVEKRKWWVFGLGAAEKCGFGLVERWWCGFVDKM
jgi:hypothetical protein